MIEEPHGIRQIAVGHVQARMSVTLSDRGCCCIQEARAWLLAAKAFQDRWVIGPAKA